jgi:hypothetical protein
MVGVVGIMDMDIVGITIMGGMDIAHLGTIGDIDRE